MTDEYKMRTDPSSPALPFQPSILEIDIGMHQSPSDFWQGLSGGQVPYPPLPEDQNIFDVTDPAFLDSFLRSPDSESAYAQASLSTVDPSTAHNTNSTRPNPRKSTAKSRKRASTSRSWRQPSITGGKLCAKLLAGTSVSYGNGCRLDHVKLCGDTVLLADYDAVAFPGQTFGQKVSFRLYFEPYMPFNRQLNVLLCQGQPSKRRLADVTVVFVEYFIKDCEQRGQPFPFKLEHLVLRRIDVVSRSRIQPYFDIVVPATA